MRSARPTEAHRLVDRHVGGRIREGRVTLGLTQGALAALLGLTFQQVQKYEAGTNRVGASRLWQLAKALRVTPGWFFEGLSARLPEPCSTEAALETRRETLEIVRAFQRIGAPRVRRRLLALAVALGEETAEPASSSQAAE